MMLNQHSMTVFRAAAITTVLAPVSLPAMAQSPSSAALPNGASSVTETFGDWTINCRNVDKQKQCLLSQVQANRQTGQRAFAIELRAPRDGKTEGTIIMPFGVNLESGAILKVDDKDIGKGFRFSTCVPQGCLLPVSFPAGSTDAIRKGGKLVAATLNAANGEAVTFNVSPNGFNAALDRITQLAR